jgi:phage anti-repressor protein
MNQQIVPKAINFQELVQNSNTTLSLNIQSKIVDKLNEEFTNKEQQWYIANLYMYMNYHATNDYPINLEHVYKMIGFANKGNAMKTIKSNFIENEDYKKLLFHTEKRKNEGGFNKETVMLNVDTFKNLCMIAKTDKGKEIRKYYVKLENIYNKIIKDDIMEKQRQLEEQSNQVMQLQSQNDQLAKEIFLQRHNVLLREFATVGPILYIVRVKSFDNGEYIIKIGESRRGIKSRYDEHRQKYSEAVVLDCFMVYKSKDFENYLHTHKDISPSRVTTLEGHEGERELFLIGKDLSYGTLQDIIKKNISNFRDNTLELEQARLEIQQLRTELSSISPSNSDYTSNNNIIKAELMDLKAQVANVLTELRLQRQERLTTNFGDPLPTLGDYVQQLNPETLQLVKVYNSIAEVCRTLKVPRSSILKACRENTVYKNFRWNLVDRQSDPNEVTNVSQTRPLVKVQNNGYIAKLNNDKTEILNVYLDRKTASIKNGYDSVAYLDYFVKHGKKVGEYFYVLYETLDTPLITNFLEKQGISDVVLYKSTGVGQFDTNGNLVREFKSKYSCQELIGIGNKSLCKALETGKQYNGCIYKYIPDKLSIL